MSFTLKLALFAGACLVTTAMAINISVGQVPSFRPDGSPAISWIAMRRPAVRRKASRRASGNNPQNAPTPSTLSSAMISHSANTDDSVMTVGERLSENRIDRRVYERVSQAWFAKTR
jgi:hypothetical protein